MKPLDGPFGVAVEGINLARLTQQAFTDLVDLLHANHIMVVRGQDLAPDDYIAFGRRWGEIVPYFQARWTLPGWPDILLITNEAVPGRALPPAENWHADGTYLSQPHSVTMLYGREAPAEGGETWFAGTALAYDTLDATERARLDSLLVKHMKNGGQRLALAEEHEKALTLASQVTPEEQENLKTVLHPLVLPHPVTGRRALYCSTTTAYGIEGMGEDEAIALLLEVKRHVLQPRFRQSYKTLPGEVLIWDNFAVLHKAAPTPLSNSDGERRLLHRITVNGLPQMARAAA
ncbi:MAG: TauD/TfdA dioxygenase family protein [Flavobacteriaceae bacterium]